MDWQNSRNEKIWSKFSKKKDTFENDENRPDETCVENSVLETDTENDVIDKETSTKSVIFKEQEKKDEDDEEMIFDQNLFQSLVNDMVQCSNREFRITKVAASIIQVYFIQKKSLFVITD